jgi:protein-S-isoprenylcysteine O-methyltransferase Ste14
MYTGLTIAYLGGSALLDSAWPVIVLRAAILILFETVISREEMYAFSAEYTGYVASVRRWL